MQYKEDGKPVDPYLEDLTSFDYSLSDDQALFYEPPFVMDGVKPVMVQKIMKYDKYDPKKAFNYVWAQVYAAKDAMKNYLNARKFYAAMNATFDELDQHFPDYITPRLKQKAMDIFYHFIKTSKGLDVARFKNLRNTFASAIIYKVCTQHCITITNEKLRPIIDEICKQSMIITKYSNLDSTLAMARCKLNDALLLLNEMEYAILKRNKQNIHAEIRKRFLESARQYLIDRCFSLEMITKLMFTIERIYDIDQHDLLAHKKSAVIPALAKIAYMINYPKQKDYQKIMAFDNTKTTIITIFNKLFSKLGIIPLTSHRINIVIKQNTPERIYNQICINDENSPILVVLSPSDRIATLFKICKMPACGTSLVHGSCINCAPFKFEIRNTKNGRFFVAVYRRSNTARFPKKTKTGTIQKMNYQSFDQKGIYEHEFVQVIAQFVENKSTDFKQISEALHISRGKTQAAAKLLQHINALENIKNKGWRLTISVNEIVKRLVACFSAPLSKEVLPETKVVAILPPQK